MVPIYIWGQGSSGFSRFWLMANWMWMSSVPWQPKDPTLPWAASGPALPVRWGMGCSALCSLISNTLYSFGVPQYKDYKCSKGSRGWLMRSSWGFAQPRAEGNPYGGSTQGVKGSGELCFLWQQQDSRDQHGAASGRIRWGVKKRFFTWGQWPCSRATSVQVSCVFTPL